MTWLSIIFWLITHAPDIMALIRQFLALLHGMPLGERNKLREVLAEAKAKGDIDAAKQVLKNTCSGVGCPSDLVRE